MLGSRCDGGCCEVTKPILMRLLVAAVIACGAHEARAQTNCGDCRPPPPPCGDSNCPPPPRSGPFTPAPHHSDSGNGTIYRRHRSHRRHRRPGDLELLQPASAAFTAPASAAVLSAGRGGSDAVATCRKVAGRVVVELVAAGLAVVGLVAAAPSFRAHRCAAEHLQPAARRRDELSRTIAFFSTFPRPCRRRCSTRSPRATA